MLIRLQEQSDPPDQVRDEAEGAGLAYAETHKATWVSPYNDGQVIAGQGTIALEILEERPNLAGSTWIVPTSGGGLISGIGAAIKPDPTLSRTKQNVTRLTAVQSFASPFMHAIYHNSSQENVSELPSLADGLAGPVEVNALTIPMIKRLVDDIILVSEEEIAEAIVYAWQQYEERIEGSAAVALAAILSGKISSRPAMLVISGGNIQPELHTRLVN